MFRVKHPSRSSLFFLSHIHLAIHKRTHYEVLRISQTAGPEAIRKAFRDRAKETHPDSAKNNNSSSSTSKPKTREQLDVETKEAAKEFRKVLEAYRVLDDVDKRRE